MEWADITFGAFLGVAGTFALLTLALFPMIRRLYMLWIVARLAAFCTMALALFPVELPAIFPRGDARVMMGDIALALAIAFTGPFLASYMSKREKLRQQRHWLNAMLPLGIGASVASLLMLRWPWMIWVHHLLSLGMIAILLVVLIVANHAGSRAARFQAVGWGPLILVGLFSLIFELATGSPPPYWPVAVLFAILIDVVITGVGVVDGFLIIKRQRDSARIDMRRARLASVTDPLTEIANRRGLANHFGKRKGRRPQGLMVLDCDNFKRINDLLGHEIGDQVLIAVTAGLRDENAFPARQGGEEFVVLLYGTGWRCLAETMRQRITLAVRESVPQVPLAVTASAGVTALEPTDTLEEAIKRADRALYAAKRAGRDRLYFEETGQLADGARLQGVA